MECAPGVWSQGSHLVPGRLLHLQPVPTASLSRPLPSSAPLWCRSREGLCTFLCPQVEPWRESAVSARICTLSGSTHVLMGAWGWAARKSTWQAEKETQKRKNTHFLTCSLNKGPCSFILHWAPRNIYLWLSGISHRIAESSNVVSQMHVSSKQSPWWIFQ